MNFDSVEYALLLTLVVPLVWSIPGRLRAYVLLLASFVFYAVWSVPMTSLIVISGLTDFAIGRLLMRTQRSGRRKALLGLSLLVNLGILGYFKYQGFFLDNLVALGLIEDGGWAAVLLPPGISFYTFQTLSYSVDVYRRELKATDSLVEFLLYVSFFPQLIAGPIERAGRLLPQFANLRTRRADIRDLAAGLRLIIFGLFKKVVIADYCGVLVDQVFATPGAAGGWTTLCACYFFTLQIYFDFAAYSEIAKGSARLFGIELIWNFDQPYLVRNVSDFWRRWHISLSTWFRDYVYKPLGGSRVGEARVLFNLAATMFLSGLWHGAAWNFVVWGLFHGALLLAYHQLSDRGPLVRLRERWPQLMGVAAWFFTLHLVIVGWILFRVERLADVPTLLVPMARALTGGEPAIHTRDLVGIVLFFAILALSYVSRRTRLLAKIDASPAASIWVYGVLAVAALLLARAGHTQFIYFQF